MGFGRWSCARHEAGHLIVAWSSGRVIGLESASAFDTSGHVAFVPVALFRDSPATRWACLVIRLAGIAAEFLSGARVTARHCRDDLMGALGEARALAALGNVEQAFPVDTASRSTIVQMYAELPAPAVTHVLEAAYLKARALLRKHRFDRMAVAVLLYLWSTLSRDDVQAFFGNRNVEALFVMKRRPLWLTLRSFGRVMLLRAKPRTEKERA